MKKLLIAGLVFLLFGNAGAANFVPTVTGNNGSLTLTVNVSFSDGTPNPFGSCPAGKFYVAAFVPNVGWYFLVENIGWVFWPGYGPMPVFSNGPLCPRTIEISRAMDVRLLLGTRVHVGVGFSGGADNSGYGYGAEAWDMLVNGTYTSVYTVPGIVDGVMRYSDVVYALWTASYPFRVTRTGVEKVQNHTGINTDLRYPFFNCVAAVSPFTVGEILVKCQDSRLYTRHILYVNPLNNGLYLYDGAEPTNIVWRGVQPFDPTAPTWGAKARVSGGWFYTTNYETWVLRFVEDGGQSTIVKAGTFADDGVVTLLISYSN